MESWFAELLQQGGPMAVSVLQLAAPALAVSIFHAISPRRWAWWAGAIAVLAILAIGLLGFVQGRGRTDDAVASWSRDAKTSKADLADMHERGYLEALRPLQFGGVFAGACALPLLVGEIRRRRRRSAVIAP